jgi:L-alanine-DL-glutamate epimerase-like enolase superfamily enzyme
MTIEAVDFFYLSMPEVTDDVDGSQDALLVRVSAGDFIGWGECEAAPLPSIAGWICPKSHGACKPVSESVLGQELKDVTDIERIQKLVHQNSLDLLQTDHILSGIDMALWDLLGRKSGEPVWKLLGYESTFPKTPYASMLFGDTPESTLEKARWARANGYRAAKFGWGLFGQSTPAADREHLQAAREGLQQDGIMLVDAGTVWIDDVERALQTLPSLEETRATWLEEPFVSGALEAYNELSKHCKTVKLAGGEGCHNFWMAKDMIDRAGVGFIQIDTGRIGGITPAKAVADYARMRGVTFVNHSFTSHLAVSASLQPYAGIADHEICEFPVEPRQLALDISREHFALDGNGQIVVPDAPGLGMTVQADVLQKYLVDAEIKVGGKVLYSTPVF